MCFRPLHVCALAAILTLSLLSAGCSEDDEGPASGEGPGAPTHIGDTTPIPLELQTWTWVGFPDAFCADGSTTGIGVNRTDGSEDVLLYLEGGGACWDALTCLTLGTAANVRGGYGEEDFASAAFRSSSAVDRARPGNPFADMSYVYVPYCTGDVHAGNAVQVYAQDAAPIHHRGAWNLDSYLSRLATTFAGAKRVFLTGSSAGAYGAQINYERVAAAFPNAEVHVLADSGQTVNPAGTRLSAWRSAWNFEVPAACEGCEEDFTKLPGYLADTHPNRRFALLAFTQDSVLRQFFGYSAADFEARTLALLSTGWSGRANTRYFVLRSASHVMLDEVGTLVGPGDVSLERFLAGWVGGTQDWANVSD